MGYAFELSGFWPGAQTPNENARRRVIHNILLGAGLGPGPETNPFDTEQVFSEGRPWPRGQKRAQ
eukprot:8206223-Lingulodinium_polyedra.AAC.1